jgi:heme/copper-type cytochrome/quinol oxidase subunit 1
MFVGFNVAFVPMYVLGLRGMPRRIAMYRTGLGWDTPNLVATIGYAVLAAGVVVFLADVAISLLRRVPAGGDPWGGYSLEWATSSPPPEHNFERLPQIRSERPAYDVHQAAREVSERLEQERGS